MGTRAKLAQWLATATAIGMFIVLLMGANVTATGSGEGCDRHWPLCSNGFLPADTIASVIEYSHRLVTGLESFLVLGATILGWQLRRRFPSFTVLVPLMAFTLVLQALMGAAAVKWPTSAEVLATHFGISLVCLASSALIALTLIEAGRNRLHNGLNTTLMRLRHPTPTGLRWLGIVALVWSIVTAYLGAYVRHTSSELACLGWPQCEGALVHGFGGHAGIHYGHRVAAVIMTILVVALLWWTWNLRHLRPDLFEIAGVAAIVVVLQSVAGGLIVITHVQLITSLLHAGLMGIFFTSICEFVRCSLPPRQVEERADIPVRVAQQPAVGA